MVVRLFFTDGSSSVRSFTDEELENLKLLDKLIDYFRDCLNPDDPIDSYEIFDIKKCPVVDDYNLRNFDLREYFNYSDSFIGLEVDGCVVKRVEFFSVDSYEYGLDSLEGEPYGRAVKFNYTIDHYYYWQKFKNFDPENWDK